jgi:predicted nuclease with RNAse H fold
MIYRSMALRRTLEAQGIPVIEVYPYASKVRLFSRPIPKKSTRAGRQWLRQRLEGLVPGLREHDGRLGHDQLDAIVAAYTAYLHGQSQAEAVGDPQEGVIYVPSARVRR